MGKKITVTPQELRNSARTITDAAADYLTDYTDLYTKMNEMSNAWQGKDNQAFITQISGFEEDFKKMHKLMEKYSEYLTKTANTYDSTQEKIAEAARKLAN